MIEKGIKRLWLQSYDREVSPNLETDPKPVYEYLDRSAELYPRRKAIVFNNWSITYSRLRTVCEQVASRLRDLGVQPRDRVAVMLPNTPQAIIAYWGVLKAGGVAVMTNPLYMEKELVHHFHDSGAKVLITLDLLWPKIEPLLPKLDLETVLITRISDCLGFPLNFLYDFKAGREGNRPSIPYDGKTVLPWKTLFKKGSSFVPCTTDPEKDLALLQYTGGTTGVSKGVMVSHANLAANVQQCEQVLHNVTKKHQVVLGIMPFFHIYGLTVCINFATAIGATLVPLPRFVPQDVLKTMVKHKPTIFPCAPSIFVALLQQKNIKDFDLSSVEYCISGSAPMPLSVMETFNEMTGATIVEGFGLTEASPITHLNPLRGTHKPGSIGLPFPGTDAGIVDMEVGTIPLEPNQVGELVIRGPQVMLGYWNRPDETATALRNRWLYTGDIAYMDEEGYFFIVDRKKDMILSGGYNVYPREIDEVLLEHPGIKEAVAVGISHPTRGEIIKAYVVLEDGVELTRGEVISFCREKLANYKIPRQVEFRTELPKTMVGKVLRRALREEEERKAGRRAEDRKKDRKN